ncbi:hypothetical protein AKJ62_04575 [candidate division MSBL1 archaeon SCGC-AAA259D14]|nr:hypothetical protein AKJ62_04575 [candidate division MSBL1 archaeon SCGC-AAA259D14]KXA92942.1 hypothetical protein AKJ66_03155 [candidate division MSBL1 archaeon SCGC-AAA259E22]KXA97115.1 hypothetical protein AKJ38_01925 [candidate division MSBL1 archaeon SCGC-AAA259I14]KXA98381.1 hypothetical protein AKJ39_02160 [candidate division MSBL1 archaeon SCGC-AAA259J03]
MSIVGLVGLAIIVIGFGYEMIKTVERRKCNIARTVVGMFILASVLLFYHAFTLGDKIFMTLNLILIGVNSVNFYYA